MKKQEKVKKTGRSIIIRAKVSVLLITLILAFLVTRLATLQLIDPDQLKNDALEQYTHEMSISAKRGTVYDRNLKPLAVSATVYNVFISPNEIKDDTQMMLIANRLSDILDVDRDSIITKCQNKRSKYQLIKKTIEDREEDLVRAFINDNNLSRVVNLEETTKRYYPYSTLACHMLGFVGTDNNGLAGIEFTYDEYLRGTNGRAVRATDATGNPLPFKYESFIEAQNGLNIITTIDYTIQSILEKYIYEAYKDNKPNGSVTGIVMDVHTGEILASALYPNFDLNNHNVLTDYYEEKLFSFNGTDEEKASYQMQLLYQMWDNSMVSKTYEPGSTFKIVTSAMALEEGIIKESDQFVCKTMIVSGIPIHCHSTHGHGVQDFATALKNSCNPAFVQIGTKVGTKIFEQYFKAFGYTDTCGTDILGEAKSIYFKTTNTQFEALELSVYSFGQTFKVTPLQHLRAVSTVANGGYLVTPHIAKALVDEKGSVVKAFEYDNERQVISKETCNIILKALVNSAKNANVSGYNVVSKTGTSQKRDKLPANLYVSSCVTFAPAEDPQIAIIVLVDEPTGQNYYGSLVAAPVISSVLSEVLPYLGIEPTHAENTDKTIGNYVGSEVAAAKLVLENLGIKCVVKGTGAIITEQIPPAGSIISQNGMVVLYTDDTPPENTIKVPSVFNLTPSAANKTIINNNLNISIKGIFGNDYTNCNVVSQSPAAGEYVAPGTIIEVEFRYTDQE
ncbi:MAG: hypothetical protein CVU97_06675 [Firmicutes bacterium HGW-Firmicutes-21]|nr:MAG: hypothetical protein CVU97_06675 [Firmicutes bacterium HGW-Firmicutes-21]